MAAGTNFSPRVRMVATLADRPDPAKCLIGDRVFVQELGIIYDVILNAAGTANTYGLPSGSGVVVTAGPGGMNKNRFIEPDPANPGRYKICGAGEQMTGVALESVAGGLPFLAQFVGQAPTVVDSGAPIPAGSAIASDLNGAAVVAVPGDFVAGKNRDTIAGPGAAVFFDWSTAKI